MQETDPQTTTSDSPTTDPKSRMSSFSLFDDPEMTASVNSDSDSSGKLGPVQAEGPQVMYMSGLRLSKLYAVVVRERQEAVEIQKHHKFLREGYWFLLKGETAVPGMTLAILSCIQEMRMDYHDYGCIEIVNVPRGFSDSLKIAKYNKHTKYGDHAIRVRIKQPPLLRKRPNNCSLNQAEIPTIDFLMPLGGNPIPRKFLRAHPELADHYPCIDPESPGELLENPEVMKAKQEERRKKRRDTTNVREVDDLITTGLMTDDLQSPEPLRTGRRASRRIAMAPPGGVKKSYVMDISDDDDEDSASSSTSSSGIVLGFSTPKVHCPPEASSSPAVASCKDANVDLEPWVYPPIIDPALDPSPGLSEHIENDYAKFPTPKFRLIAEGTREAVAKRKYRGFPTDGPSDDEDDEDFHELDDDHTGATSTHKRARSLTSASTQQKSTINVARSSKQSQAADTHKSKHAVASDPLSFQGPFEKLDHKVASRVRMRCDHCGFNSGLYWRDQDTKIRDYCQRCLKHRTLHKVWGCD